MIGFTIAREERLDRLPRTQPLQFYSPSMNALGFFLRRLAWQFGIRGERARWNSVTRETQILSEAQDLLGKLAWRNTSKIDDLTGEYWQLKDLDDQQAKLREQSEQLLDRVEQLKEKLHSIEDRYDDQIDGLRQEKDQIMEQAGEMTAAMEEIRDEDAATRERFGSLKMKLDVLKRQEGLDLSAEIEKTRTALHQLKLDHEQFKSQLESKETELRKVEVSVQAVDARIAQKREEMKVESADLVTEIGKLSKTVAEISAKIGALENAKTELSFKVGQYLSNNAESRPIVGKITALRKSIQYNQRLARRTRN
jgi:chromosome segregation ATPase